jgi:ABC-type bacteriocin/lantibiotic exporter with double-glycine peptidase domain
MLGGLSFPLKQTDKRLVSYLESRTAHFKVLLFQYWILVFFKVIVSAGLVIMGVFLLINQQLNIGQFVAAEIIVLLLISSVEKLIGYMDKVYDVITSFEKLAKLGDLPSEEGRSFNKEAIMTNQQWEFEVKQLGFGHDGRSSLFSGIDFRVQTGMTLGIKGGNGSGKSSLLKVLAGLYHPTDGSILLNGLPLSSYELLDYKENIGFCVDQPELIEGSLRDNVVMGREGIGEDAISKLTLALNLEPLLNSIPEKWDYKVHAAGKALPKKLKQKLMLMRSLVHQPRLVLLDEPWHGLDQNSQINMRNCILNYSKEAIVIVTSNDPVFLEKCNLVIDLESF